MATGFESLFRVTHGFGPPTEICNRIPPGPGVPARWRFSRIRLTKEVKARFAKKFSGSPKLSRSLFACLGSI